MKLRLRSLEFNGTLKIKYDSSPSSLHLSFNGKDEIRASSPHDSLHSLGVAADDLIFYSFNPTAFSRETLPHKPESASCDRPSVQNAPETLAGDAPSAVVLSTSSEAFFVRRVPKEALGNDLNDLKLLVLTFHRVVVEYGFVRIDKEPGTARKFEVSDTGAFCDCLWGLSDDSGWRLHHVCLDKGESKGSDVFEMLKMVKDRVALPLLIDLCEKSGLDLPPCFMELVMELKLLILERVPGVDLAKVACTCSELRFLCNDNELWKKKYLEEFGYLEEFVRKRKWLVFKDFFALTWEEKRTKLDIG
ncbi:hypothetical protein ACSQ67_009926 [Phaseolus vulgaris]